MANISTRQLRKNQKLIDGLSDKTVNAEEFMSDYVPTRTELGQFFTPLDVVDKMLSYASIREGEKVLEPTCGVGNILHKLPEDALGIELDTNTAELAKQLTGREVVNDNLFSVFMDYENTFDCVVGNPPFGNKMPGTQYLDYEFESGARAEAMAIEAIYHMLKEDGRAVLLLPSMIAQGGRNYSKLYKFLESKEACLEMVYNCGVVDFKTTKIGCSIYELWK